MGPLLRNWEGKKKMNLSKPNELALYLLAQCKKWLLISRGLIGCWRKESYIHLVPLFKFLTPSIKEDIETKNGIRYWERRTLESYLKIKKVDYNNLIDVRGRLVIRNQDFFVTGEYVRELPSSEVLVILSRKYKNPSCAGQSNCLSRFFFFPFPYVSDILFIDFAWLKLSVELLRKHGSNERE